MSILDVQNKLAAAGFDPGPLDGVWGTNTSDALDEALALAVAARDGPPPPAEPVSDSAPVADVDRLTAAFGPLSDTQVAGINAVLNATAAWPREPAAYALATPWLETGGKMQPVAENLNYSVEGLIKKFSPHRISQADAARFGRSSAHPADQRMIANLIYGGAWGVMNLGNTVAGDGWLYRGRGLSQITGRGAYQRLGDALGIDLVGDPDLALDLDNAADILAVGMQGGLFSGHKLSAYFGDGEPDWVGARHVINGTDRAADVAGYAQKFLAAITA